MKRSKQKTKTECVQLFFFTRRQFIVIIHVIAGIIIFNRAYKTPTLTPLLQFTPYHGVTRRRFIVGISTDDAQARNRLYPVRMTNYT